MTGVGGSVLLQESDITPEIVELDDDDDDDDEGE